MSLRKNTSHAIWRKTGLIVTLLILVLTLSSGCKPVFANPSQSETTSSTTAPTTLPEPTVTPTPEPSPTPNATPTPLPPSLNDPVIALTFDDGPSLRDTGGLLDLLAAEDVKVTFFVLGNQIASGREDLVRRAWEEGHEIANHSYSHTIFTGESAELVRDELEKTNQLIYDITGEMPSVMRPPTGSYDDQVLAISRDMGLAVVNWSWQSCPEDWNHTDDPEHIADHVIANAANGHIVLLHDTNSATVASMPAMIAGLKERGFRFVTVSELLAWQGEGHPQPGEIYHQYTP